MIVDHTTICSVYSVLSCRWVIMGYGLLPTDIQRCMVRHHHHLIIVCTHMNTLLSLQYHNSTSHTIITATRHCNHHNRHRIHHHHHATTTIITTIATTLLPSPCYYYHWHHTTTTITYPYLCYRLALAVLHLDLLNCYVFTLCKLEYVLLTVDNTNSAIRIAIYRYGSCGR